MNAIRKKQPGGVNKPSTNTRGKKDLFGGGGNRFDTLKQLSTNKSGRKQQRVFGDRCFDYIVQCRHKLNSKSDPGMNSSDPDYVNCPYCRLINLSLKPFFQEEELERQAARQLSLRNRSVLRTKLLYQWSQSSSYHYQYMELDNCIDVIFSVSLVSSIISNDSLLQTIQKRVKKSFWFGDKGKSSDPEGNEGNGEDNENQLSLVDFDEMIKILHRNKRINEIGNLAAIFLQSYIRRYLIKIKIRERLLRRFEYVPPSKTQDDYYYDKKTLRKWYRCPLLIASERPGTPRTIDRRINHENKLKNKKYENYLSLRKEENKRYDKNSTFFKFNFFQKNIKIIQYLKQLIILRDLLYLSIYQLNQLEKLKIIKKEEEEKEKSSNDVLSQLSSLGVSSKSTIALIDKEKSANNVKISDNFSSSLLNENNMKPVWLIPTAPGLPSRELGLALALLTTTSPANRMSTTPAAPPASAGFSPTPMMRKNSNLISEGGTSSGGAGRVAGGPTLTPTQRALQILEQASWDCLICHSPEEIIQKLLIKDLLPIYESVLNFSQDEFGIWNSKFKKNSTLPMTGGAIGINSSVSDDQPIDLGFTELPIDTAAIPYEILPFGFQLRLLNHPVEGYSANGFFRCFFYDEELVGVSANSPWVFYPEVYKNRDSILSSIVRFLNQPNIKQYIHNVYLTTNKTHPKYQQQLNANSGLATTDTATKRRQSVVGGANNTPSSSSSVGRSNSNRRGSVTGGNNNASQQKLSNKQDNYLSTFIPSESMIFNVDNLGHHHQHHAHSHQHPPSTNPSLSATRTMTNDSTMHSSHEPRKASLYNEAVIHDLNTLTDEQIIKINEAYK
jgi:hypothetical protein